MLVSIDVHLLMLKLRMEFFSRMLLLRLLLLMLRLMLVCIMSVEVVLYDYVDGGLYDATIEVTVDASVGGDVAVEIIVDACAVDGPYDVR